MRTPIFLLSLVLVAGCAGASSRGSLMTATRLYLGTKIGHDREVSAADWEDFLARSIVPRFPDGMSLEEATGLWRDAGGTLIHERTRVLLLVHDDDEKSEESIRAIEAEYRRRFQQESVLRTDEPVQASFD